MGKEKIVDGVDRISGGANAFGDGMTTTGNFINEFMQGFNYWLYNTTLGEFFIIIVIGILGFILWYLKKKYNINLKDHISFLPKKKKKELN